LPDDFFVLGMRSLLKLRGKYFARGCEFSARESVRLSG
jgi:hypothetical protein